MKKMKTVRRKLKKMNKKAFAPLMGLLILSIIVVAVLVSTGSLKLNLATVTGSGGYIERPVFSYVKCEAISELKYSTRTL